MPDLGPIRFFAMIFPAPAGEYLACCQSINMKDGSGASDAVKLATNVQFNLIG